MWWLFFFNIANNTEYIKEISLFYRESYIYNLMKNNTVELKNLKVIEFFIYK